MFATVSHSTHFFPIHCFRTGFTLRLVTQYAPRIEFEEDKQDRILVKQRENSAEIYVDIDDL
jgi:hypothetical protein